MKEPIETLILEKFIINIYDENDYSFNSADNAMHYGHVYVDIDRKQPTTLFGIEVLVDDKRYRSCLIGASGGSSGLSENATLIGYRRYVICCSDTVFAFTLPDLQLLWKTKADSTTCLEVFQLGEDYIVHGEQEITRLGRNGKIMWQRTGADIFVTADGGGNFKVEDNYILVRDWENKRYIFGANGETVSEEAFSNRAAGPLYPVGESKDRPWWKVWS